jgi:hypothetical protein
MSEPIKLPAIFSGIRSRKDKTLSLTFDTQELAGQDAARLMDLQQSYCALLIAPQASDLERAEVPEYRMPEGSTKTPGQRLRAVLYIYHEQQGGEAVLGPFNSWYERVIERYINLWKAKLDGGES